MKAQTVVRALVAVAMLSTISALILVFGRIDGIEFDMSTLQKRRYREYEIPLVGSRIVRFYRDPEPVELWHFLQKQGFLQRNYGTASWMQIYSSSNYGHNNRSNIGWMKGNVGEGNWIEWTKNNPALARELWGEIDQLLASRIPVEDKLSGAAILLSVINSKKSDEFNRQRIRAGRLSIGY